MAGRWAGWKREMPMDDPALVEALQAGDPQAQRLLIERYQGVVFGLCYRMMSHRQDAEDVAQETFLRAWRRRETFRARSTLRAWLYGIATNASLDLLQHRARRFLPQFYPIRSSAMRESRRGGWHGSPNASSAGWRQSVPM